MLLILYFSLFHQVKNTLKKFYQKIFFLIYQKNFISQSITYATLMEKKFKINFKNYKKWKNKNKNNFKGQCHGTNFDDDEGDEEDEREEDGDEEQQGHFAVVEYR